MIARRAVGGGLLGAIALAACSRSDIPPGRSAPGEVRFSIHTEEAAPAAQAGWRPILADMRSRTGLTVTPVFSSDSRRLVEAMKAKETDVGLFSDRSALDAERRADGQVFARAFDGGGGEGHASVLIVAARSRISLEQILKCGRRLTFATGDASSITGTLAPLTYLFAPRDIDPAACFRQVRRIADRRARLIAVARGNADVAASDTAILPSGQGLQSVRILWRSPLLPNDPLIWRRDLDPAVKEKLRQFFLTYGQGGGSDASGGQANLAAVGLGGFRPADDTHLLPAREMEATWQWLEAKKTRDPARIAAAARTLAAIRAERVALEARTRAPAAAQ